MLRHFSKSKAVVIEEIKSRTRNQDQNDVFTCVLKEVVDRTPISLTRIVNLKFSKNIRQSNSPATLQ